jgi:hypothetical protein
MQKHLLSPEDVLSLYRKYGKHILLKVRCNKSVGYDNAIGIIVGIVKENISGMKYSGQIKYIAGTWSNYPGIDYHTQEGWKVTRASKSDLLLYLDKVVDSKLATKILNGTLRVV